MCSRRRIQHRKLKRQLYFNSVRMTSALRSFIVASSVHSSVYRSAQRGDDVIGTPQIAASHDAENYCSERTNRPSDASDSMACVVCEDRSERQVGFRTSRRAQHLDFTLTENHCFGSPSSQLPYVVRIQAFQFRGILHEASAIWRGRFYAMVVLYITSMHGRHACMHGVGSCGGVSFSCVRAPCNLIHCFNFDPTCFLSFPAVLAHHFTSGLCVSVLVPALQLISCFSFDSMLSNLVPCFSFGSMFQLWCLLVRWRRGGFLRGHGGPTAVSRAGCGPAPLIECWALVSLCSWGLRGAWLFCVLLNDGCMI